MTESTPTLRQQAGWQDKSNPYKLEWIDRHVKGDRVLDIGSGMGWYAVYVSQKGYHVTAIDIVRQFQNKGMSFIISDIEAFLPLQAHCFDTVLALDVIEHISDETRLLKEIYRVLKPGGTLLFSVPHSDDSMLSGSYLTYCHFKDKTHKREYTMAQLRERLKANRFVAGDLMFAGGQTFPYVPCRFIENRLFRRLTRGYLHLLYRVGIIQLKNAHADIFGVAFRPRHRD